MGSYRNISIGFWTDSKVDDEFTPEDKYFYLYLLTNPHTNICGCYEVGMSAMVRETGYNEDTIKRLLRRLENEHGVIRYSAETKEVLVIHWGKYNWSRSEKLVKAVLSVGGHIKNDAFREYIYAAVNNNVPTDKQTTDKQITDNRLQTTDVSIGYRYPINTVSKKNRFCDFPQNEVDFDALSKKVFVN